MLGVLKRRWKPKRSSTNTRIPSEEQPLTEKPPRLCPSARQVHPLGEEKPPYPLCGDTTPTPDANDQSSPPPPYLKRASFDVSQIQPQESQQCYPLSPNICVEGGRIQFVRNGVVDQEGSVSAPVTPPRITVTRGLQTDEGGCGEFQVQTKNLENRILELETALEGAHKNELRDKQLITKLQKQLSRREAAHRDADRERRMRVDSESRAKQAIQEATRCRSRLKLLTAEFSRMEDTVRSMLVYKKQVEQLRQEKATLTITFENRCTQYQGTISRLNQEIEILRDQLERVGLEVNPEEILEAHTAALQRHVEESRKQYERCLDDVANQVVRALLAQKGLREEILNLNNKIQELESQNRALTSMLVHQLRVETPSENKLDLKNSAFFDNKTLLDVSPTVISQNIANVKHCNSFNSEVLDEISPAKNEDFINSALRSDKNDDDIIDTRFSLEDKKRHQVLTKLWTELKGTEVTPKKLLKALSQVDSSLWVPPKRPVSLNLHLPLIQPPKYRRSRPVLAQSSSKSEEETTGNESPESGNRDEGYSTMSSDVQADCTRSSAVEASTSRELEDLKEATDETELIETRLLVADSKDPDILYIPLNILNIKSRNSYPPGKDMLPFQHIMRSFSDSHLCIKITTAPSPCCTFTSPISSSPSIFLFDLTEKNLNPLRRTRASSTLWGHNLEICDDRTSQLSWSSGTEDRLECGSWDAEYIQHWLRLDETRSALQQQHRDMLELDYDRTELEDWSLSLSNEEQWKRNDVITPGQISISTLPSIQENNTLELEEDSNECLWNNSSYMMDREGRELVTLLMDTTNQHCASSWPYASGVSQQVSPDNSWSSGGSDCCHSHEPETCSKRSSAAMSGYSDDTGEIPAVGTDFTRDFYRLVKFESTKSLASTSSRSVGGALSENSDREATLQNVLTFIAEQQKYVQAREGLDIPPSPSINEITTELTKENNTTVTTNERDNNCDNINSDNMKNNSENYVTLKQLCEEYTLNEQNLKESNKLAYAEQICLSTPIELEETENCSDIKDTPVDICSSINVELTSTDYQNSVLSSDSNNLTDSNSMNNSLNSMNNSLTSSVSTPETIVSKIPRRKPSKIPISPAKTSKSKIPSKKPVKQQLTHVKQTPAPAQHIITSENLPQCASGVLSRIIDGPPHRAVSFHERATSKDVIDELNRIIKNGDDAGVGNNVDDEKLDQSCKPTGWVHVERDIDLTDPKARANLLDVMMASGISSDSSPTSSCGGSVASESAEDPPNYSHLHRIHKFHRQKKANAVRPEMAVVRAIHHPPRPSIVGRADFFLRYGDKEREAVASFDFLDEFKLCHDDNN